jgi:hypothetical protein
MEPVPQKEREEKYRFFLLDMEPVPQNEVYDEPYYILGAKSSKEVYVWS